MAKTKYTETEAQRRSVIDYLTENPGAFARDILAQLGWDQSTGIKRLKKMLDLEELRREEVQKERTETSKRVSKIFRYWAIVTSPRPIDYVRDHRRRRKVERQKEAEARVDKLRSGPGYFRNCDPNRPAIPNQGGQGSVSRYMESPLSSLD